VIHEKFQVFTRGVLTLGRKTVRRTSFLLSQDGEIIHEWRKIHPKTHGQEIYNWMQTYLANQNDGE